MNNKSDNSEIFQQNISFDSQQQKTTYSSHSFESNNEAISRLCENIFFMTQDNIIFEQITLANDHKD